MIYLSREKRDSFSASLKEEEGKNKGEANVHMQMVPVCWAPASSGLGQCPRQERCARVRLALSRHRLAIHVSRLCFTLPPRPLHPCIFRQNMNCMNYVVRRRLSYVQSQTGNVC